MRAVLVTAVLLGLALASQSPQTASAQAAAASPPALVEAMRQGGYVVVMRHAASPQTPPPPELANKDNTTLERQLDETGRRTAQAMGSALRSKAVPVGEVQSSPTYRALETARLIGFSNVKTAPELGEGSASMQAASRGASTWLRMRATIPPVAGKNTFYITHFPNIRAAFPEQSSALGDGEALIFKPDGSNEPKFVGRLAISSW